jgi:hypothetical protein
MVKAVGMIAVPVRDDNRIEVPKIDAEGRNVAREPGGIVTGVEEDSMAVVLDQRGEPPVVLKPRSRPEGIGEDRDPVGRLSSRRNRDQSRNARKKCEKVKLHRNSLPLPGRGRTGASSHDVADRRSPTAYPFTLLRRARLSSPTVLEHDWALLQSGQPPVKIDPLR